MYALVRLRIAGVITCCDHGSGQFFIKLHHFFVLKMVYDVSKVEWKTYVSTFLSIE